MIKKHLVWIIPLIFILGYLIGNYNGYTDKQLNIGNAIEFCESVELIMCSWSSQEIICGEGNCYMGSPKWHYENPTFEFKYKEGE